MIHVNHVNHVIVKRLRTLLLTFDLIVVFLFSCFKQEVEGIVMMLSILIASFTSFNSVTLSARVFLSSIHWKE